MRQRLFQLVDALTSEPWLQGYHLLRSVRGNLLFKLGRFDEAREKFERAVRRRRSAASGTVTKAVRFSSSAGWFRTRATNR